jgi:two-component system sensor histidine kinase RegB
MPDAPAETRRAPRDGLAGDAPRVTLRGVLLARWALLGVLSPLAWLQHVMPAELGLTPAGLGLGSVLALLVAWALVNLLAWRHSRAERLHPAWGNSGMQILLDVAALTGFFALTGAAANPLTTLYLFPITLATQVSQRWTAGIALASAVGFALLFAFPSPVLDGPHGKHFAGHLAGMWIALAVSGGLITLFIHRIAGALAAQRAELQRLREASAETRHLAALGGLAAGAAHELGTPLGTVRLLIDELEAMNPDERAHAIADVRSELERCKSIVHDMANPELSARTLDQSEPWRLIELAAHLDVDVSPSRLHVEVTNAAHEAPPAGHSLRVISRIVRELMTNAVRACKAKATETNIYLTIDAASGHALFTVEDDGTGMLPEVAVAAFQPFFSTRAEGRGLGLFLARAHVEQLGGAVELETVPGRGTKIRVLLPLLPRAAPDE